MTDRFTRREILEDASAAAEVARDRMRLDLLRLKIVTGTSLHTNQGLFVSMVDVVVLFLRGSAPAQWFFRCYPVVSRISMGHIATLMLHLMVPPMPPSRHLHNLPVRNLAQLRGLGFSVRDFNSSAS